MRFNTLASFTLLLLAFEFGAILTAPAKDYDESNVELHDQRQNGTENYRLDMKDVFIVLSPVDSMLSAAGIASDAGIMKPPTQTGSDLSSLTFLADLKDLDNNSPEIGPSSFQSAKPMKKW